jgi:hypothetical protein
MIQVFERGLNSSFRAAHFEWSIIQPLLPTKVRSVKRVDDRPVLNGAFPCRRHSM